MTIRSANLRNLRRRPPTTVLGSIALVAGLGLSSLLAAAPANAADVSFADPALQACVNQRLGQPDTAPVSTTQAAGITQLNCYNLGITNLGGIQKLTS
ncbi:hypothetical protein, partial [Arthrobacter sp. GMC3]|uniref:hypothetical protein n=1 Tax=Arthrobacter sp. GMC3 TaxID=2058894 RepID=UPI0011B0A915